MERNRRAFLALNTSARGFSRRYVKNSPSSRREIACPTPPGRLSRATHATKPLSCDSRPPNGPRLRNCCDTVALLEDLPERKLKCGEVGTVVEKLGPGVFEVEFCDDHGHTYAELALRGDQLVVLHNQGDVLRIVA